jgi:hypothetical protein
VISEAERTVLVACVGFMKTGVEMDRSTDLTSTVAKQD